MDNNKKAVHDNNISVYNVGDTKIVTIGTNNYTVRIANKSTSANCSNTNYSQTACGFVVEFADIVTSRQMRSTATNVGGYPETLIYSYLRDTLFEQLPGDLRSVIEPTRVISGYGSSDSNNYVTTDYLYLLSGVEVFGSDSVDTAASTTTQLDFYKDISNSKVKKLNSIERYWWLRTASSNFNHTFRCVSNSGNLGSPNANDDNRGISPAFRIA